MKTNMSIVIFCVTFLILTMFSGLYAAEPESLTSSIEPVISITGPALRSSDLDRSIRFYSEGLGMNAYTFDARSNIEVAVSAPNDSAPPIIMLFKSKDPANSPPIEIGNGFGRIILGVNDAVALAAKLTAAGYTPSEVRVITGYGKIFSVKDPDGYSFEITERSGIRQKK